MRLHIENHGHDPRQVDLVWAIPTIAQAEKCQTAASRMLTGQKKSRPKAALQFKLDDRGSGSQQCRL
jgi:hypothetical protein